MENDQAIGLLEQGIEELGFLPAKARGSTRSGHSGGGQIQLVESDGVVHWDIGEKRRVTRGRQNRLQTYRFEDLSPNQISKRLQELDSRLTPDQGIREVTVSEVGGGVIPIAEGRILLLIHGTFSNSENLLGEISATEDGQNFLNDAAGQYDQMLAFSHPTLSVSPFLNALQLARGFHGSRAEVDIICHSRGGLVVRWWLETLLPEAGPKCRVVFVGSPLAGTGLASPANIRQSLDLLANLSRKLAVASGIGSAVFPIAAPMFQASAVIAGMLSTVSSAGAATPAIDAAIHLVPGLAAQSRQGANQEIVALRNGFTGSASLRERLDGQVQRYYFVKANFESEDPGWAFWRFFRKLPGRVVDAVTAVVFDGPNDLVVDTASMLNLCDASREIDADRQLLDFGTTDSIHHCNYFRQPRTMSFLSQSFDQK